jgi:hypothetical protein
LDCSAWQARNLVLGVAGFLDTKSFHQHLPTMTEHGLLMQLAIVFLVSGR